MGVHWAPVRMHGEVTLILGAIDPDGSTFLIRSARSGNFELYALNMQGRSQRLTGVFAP